jgi:hypothetical protein
LKRIGFSNRVRHIKPLQLGIGSVRAVRSNQQGRKSLFFFRFGVFIQVVSRSVNPQVPGSSPGRGAIEIKGLRPGGAAPFSYQE